MCLFHSFCNFSRRAVTHSREEPDSHCFFERTLTYRVLFFSFLHHLTAFSFSFFLHTNAAQVHHDYGGRVAVISWLLGIWCPLNPARKKEKRGEEAVTRHSLLLSRKFLREKESSVVLNKNNFKKKSPGVMIDDKWKPRGKELKNTRQRSGWKYYRCV